MNRQRRLVDYLVHCRIGSLEKADSASNFIHLVLNWRFEIGKIVNQKQTIVHAEVRLLYIAMTRAMEQLLITACGSNELTEQLAVVIEDVA